MACDEDDVARGARELERALVLATGRQVKHGSTAPRRHPAEQVGRLGLAEQQQTAVVVRRRAAREQPEPLVGTAHQALLERDLVVRDVHEPRARRRAGARSGAGAQVGVDQDGALAAHREAERGRPRDRRAAFAARGADHCERRPLVAACAQVVHEATKGAEARAGRSWTFASCGIGTANLGARRAAGRVILDVLAAADAAVREFEQN